MVAPKSLSAILLPLAISKLLHQQIYTGGTDNVRSVLEYAAQVWQDIPAYLPDAIESIQRRAFGIIFPNSSYHQALDLNNLTLANRRIFLCKKLMADMRNESHPIILPGSTSHSTNYTIYHLRSGSSTAPKTMKGRKTANDFFTFRFA